MDATLYSTTQVITAMGVSDLSNHTCQNDMKCPGWVRQRTGVINNTFVNRPFVRWWSCLIDHSTSEKCKRTVRGEFAERLVQFRALNAGVGVMQAHAYLHRLPGWEPGSYGYHGDDGHIYHAEGKGKPYGDCYTTGDVVGVCVDFVQSTISFYKNGLSWGVAFGNVTAMPLFPCVGFRSEGAQFRVNLGVHPFRCVFCCCSACDATASCSGWCFSPVPVLRQHCCCILF